MSVPSGAYTPACGMTRPTLTAPPPDVVPPLGFSPTLLPQPPTAAVTPTAPSAPRSCRRVNVDPAIARPSNVLRNGLHVGERCRSLSWCQCPQFHGWVGPHQGRCGATGAG